MTRPVIFTGTLVNVLVDYGVPRENITLESDSDAYTLRISCPNGDIVRTFTSAQIINESQLVIESLIGAVACYYTINKKSARWDGTRLIYGERSDANSIRNMLTVIAVVVSLLITIYFCLVNL